VIDFDGTIAEIDVGDAICERFAPPAWRQVDQRWTRGEISLPEAQRQMWALVRGTRAQMQDYAREAATFRSGLAVLLGAARDRGYRVVVASGGFDFYIEAALSRIKAEVGVSMDAVHCNGARFENGGMIPVFSGAEDLGCPTCAVCKGTVCDRERASSGGRVVFVGDGHSDRCAIGRADAIAAVQGEALERLCGERRHPHLSFTDLAEVVPLLA